MSHNSVFTTVTEEHEKTFRLETLTVMDVHDPGQADSATCDLGPDHR